jgi:TolA-binding protein
MVEPHEGPGDSPTPTPPAANSGGNLKPSPSERKHAIVPMVMGAIAVFLVVVWYVRSRQPVAPAPAPANAPGTAATAPANSPTPAAAPAPDLAADVKALRTEIEGLSSRMKDLQSRVESIPKPAPAPDLEPLQAKINDVAKAAETAGALSKKVDALDERIASLDKSLATVRDETNALRDEVKKVSAPATAPAAASTEPKPETTPEPAKPALADAAALAPAVDLFKEGKYKEASDAFQKLATSHPDDARGWYYAALATGLATRNWQGETIRLVTKGVEREKAGTPKTADIDAAFRDLTATTGKDWLSYYRKTARP